MSYLDELDGGAADDPGAAPRNRAAFGGAAERERQWARTPATWWTAPGGQWSANAGWSWPRNSQRIRAATDDFATDFDAGDVPMQTEPQKSLSPSTTTGQTSRGRTAGAAILRAEGATLRAGLAIRGQTPQTPRLSRASSTTASTANRSCEGTSRQMFVLTEGLRRSCGPSAWTRSPS